MPIESVDLISLLKRARKSAADNAAAVVHQEPEAPAVETPPVRIEPIFVDEKVELEDLRNELHGDEVLIQRILGMLYRRKKKSPDSGYISILDLEEILGIEREGAAFVMSYMKNQKVIEMDDKSRMSITVTGIIYLRTVLGILAVPAMNVSAIE